MLRERSTRRPKVKLNESIILRATLVEHNFFEALDREDFLEVAVSKALSVLNHREQEIIKHKYGLCGFTRLKMKDLAKIFNATSSRLGSIEERARYKMYKGLKKLENMDIVNEYGSEADRRYVEKYYGTGSIKTLLRCHGRPIEKGVER